MGRERRRRSTRPTSRSTRNPAASGVPGVTPAAGSAPTGSGARAAAPVQVRSDRVLERESATMMSELKRVGIVSAICFGMLAVLVVVERLQ